MTFVKGNRASVGNKGGGRKSAYQELSNAQLLHEMFYGELDGKKLKKMLKAGKYSLHDKFIEKALNGNERILAEVFRKLFPEKYEHEFKRPINITVTRGDGTTLAGSVPEAGLPMAQKDNKRVD